MRLEYRITFDTETRKGEMAFFQGEEDMGGVVKVKSIHIAQSRTVDHIKDASGTIVSMHKIGPTMTTFTMTGDDSDE